MVRFVLGLIAGGIIGVFAMCLCQAAGQRDEGKVINEPRER